MKYAKATGWIFLSWVARRLHLPTQWVDGLDDEACMARFTCSLDFEPVEIVTERPER